MLSVRHKVLAYILRAHNTQREVLVFEHRDFPEAGIQVPAGTVDPDEPFETALFREIQEESGLTPAQLQLVAKLTEDDEPGEWPKRWHVYHLVPTLSLPDTWAHTVAGAGEDAGMVFNYYWLPLAEGAQRINRQGQFLALLT